ncbi:hypothetical protein [Sphaerisporangium fuscum]|uniref:hypothetical protein n=1 Tax=Sphaerisporangium fuscum TaxID=2835868 RepID=UPI001BDD3375|nr:hypothetical protein [Sphaerisporangium fuscum]
MSTAVVTCPAALLHASGSHIKNLFRAVTAHAAEIDPDDYVIPALTQIHIEVSGGEIRLICSDRFSMGIVRTPASSVFDDFATSFAVLAEDVECALESLGDEQASLIVGENTLRISTSTGNHRFPGVRSDMPWRMVLGKVLAPQSTPTGNIALNPDQLARFQAVKPLEPEQPMLFRLSGEHGAVVATLGTTFLGLVMPVRLNAEHRPATAPERPLDAWFDIIDEPSAERGDEAAEAVA